VHNVLCKNTADERVMEQLPPISSLQVCIAVLQVCCRCAAGAAAGSSCFFSKFIFAAPVLLQVPVAASAGSSVWQQLYGPRCSVAQGMQLRDVDVYLTTWWMVDQIQVWRRS
jgi:hypothetical protein